MIRTTLAEWLSTAKSPNTGLDPVTSGRVPTMIITLIWAATAPSGQAPSPEQFPRSGQIHVLDHQPMLAQEVNRTL